MLWVGKSLEKKASVCHADALRVEVSSVGPVSSGRTRELWWAWVDLNHRPRPYQDCDLCPMFAYHPGPRGSLKPTGHFILLKND